MKKISRKKLNDLQSRGRVVSRPKPKEKPKPKPAPKQEIEIKQNDAAVTAAADSMKQSASLMQAIQMKLEEMEIGTATKSESYRFIVKRDARGFTEYVDVIPLTETRKLNS